MIQLTALYGHPQDPAAFDAYYAQTHGPLATKIPGLRGYISNKPTALNPNEKSPHYLIAELYFDSMESLQAGFQSSEGQAAAADVQNFATGGCTLVIGEVTTYMPVSIS